MKTKIVGIFVCMLLLTMVIPITGDIESTYNITNPNNRDTGKTYEEYYVQFSIFGTTLLSIEPIANSLKTAIEAQDRDLLSWVIIHIKKDFERDLKNPEGSWQIIIQYKFELEDK